jgi:hypothetical protein
VILGIVEITKARQSQKGQNMGKSGDAALWKDVGTESLRPFLEKEARESLGKTMDIYSSLRIHPWSQHLACFVVVSSPAVVFTYFNIPSV